MIIKKTRKSKKSKKSKKNRSRRQKGGDQEEKDNYLFDAISLDDPDKVERAINNGADINHANSAGDTPLYVASEMGYVEVVRILLENGADINKAESNGQTPLMIAVEYGHFELVEVLLEYGANLNAKTNEGYTAFDMANEDKFPEIATLLKTSQQKNLATKNIKEYKQPIPSLRSLAYRQLDTKTTSEINENKNMLLPPSKVGGKGKKTKKRGKKTKKKGKKNKKKTKRI